MIDLQRIAQILGNMNGGGVEQMVLSYYKAIDRREIQFDFYIFENSKYVPQELIDALGGTVTALPRFKHPIKYINTLKKCLKDGKYNIVHCHLSTLSVLPLFAAKLAGVPVRIVHNHSTSGGKRELVRNIAKTLLKPFAVMFATHRAACSEYAAHWIYGKRSTAALGQGSSPREVTIIPNAVDTAKFAFDENKRAEIRKELGLADSTKLYGHIGRFCPQKNQSFLADIFAEILKIEPDSRLAFVGTGSDMELIKEYCRTLNISEKVIFAGQRNDADKFYCAFDCFVMPSNYEGLPVVGVEAQCSGVSCLFSDRITREVLLCDNAQMLSLSDAPRQWAEAAVKASQRHSDSAAEQVKSKGFDIYQQAAALRAFYESLERE